MRFCAAVMGGTAPRGRRCIRASRLPLLLLLLLTLC